jgi:hypothetical protein
MSDERRIAGSNPPEEFFKQAILAQILSIKFFQLCPRALVTLAVQSNRF